MCGNKPSSPSFQPGFQRLEGVIIIGKASPAA